MVPFTRRGKIGVERIWPSLFAAAEVAPMHPSSNRITFRSLILAFI